MHTGEFEGGGTSNRYRGKLKAYTGFNYNFDLKEDKDMEFLDFPNVDFDEFYETEFYVREVPAGLGGSNGDEILDRYEALADDYIRLYKMSLSGNITAATEMVSVLSDYESLSEEIENAGGTMTTAQANSYNNIQRRLLDEIQEYEKLRLNENSFQAPAGFPVGAWVFSLLCLLLHFLSSNMAEYSTK